MYITRNGAAILGFVASLGTKAMQITVPSGGTETLYYESAQRPPSEQKPSETPPPAKTLKPYEKLVEDAKLKQVLTQMRYLAETLGEMDAANSLQLLTSITMADVLNGAKGGSIESVLQGHYDTISQMLGVFLQRTEQILQDWAAIDAAERRGE